MKDHGVFRRHPQPVELHRQFYHPRAHAGPENRGGRSAERHHQQLERCAGANSWNCWHVAEGFGWVAGLCVTPSVHADAPGVREGGGGRGGGEWVAYKYVGRLSHFIMDHASLPRRRGGGDAAEGLGHSSRHVYAGVPGVGGRERGGGSVCDLRHHTLVRLL